MSDFIFDLGFTVDKSDLNSAEKALEKVGLTVKNINKDTGKIDIAVDTKKLNASTEQIAKIKTAMQEAAKQGITFETALEQIGFSEFNTKTNESINALKKLDKSLKDVAKESRDTERELKEISRAAEQAARSVRTADTAFDQLRNNMAQGLGQTIAFGAIAGVGTAFVSAIQETMQLDQVLTDLQIVSEGTRAEMEALADSAFDLAGGLGTTGQKFLEASLIFEQQGGLAAKYAKDMAEATVIASNITGQSMDEMSDQITAVANGYKLLEEKGGDAGLYITDVMAKLGAVSGSGLDEMAAALQRTATVADLAGYSFEEITAQIATVSEVTRRSPEVIGTAFKSIILSFQQLREAGAKELEVFTSKVEEAFKLSGMENKLSIFDDTGNLRDARDIMVDIAGQWESMSKEGQALISESVAGKEQAEVFAVLMENWGRSQELLGEAQTAQGTALEQQTVYMDSIQAKTEALKNEWGELVHNIVSSDLFKGIVEGMTGVLQGFNDIEGAFATLSSIMGPLIATGMAFFQTGDKISQTIGQRALEKAQEAIRLEMQQTEGVDKRIAREQELIKIKGALGEQAADLYNQEKTNLQVVNEEIALMEKRAQIAIDEESARESAEASLKKSLEKNIQLNEILNESKVKIENSVKARNELNNMIAKGLEDQYTTADVQEQQKFLEEAYGVKLKDNYETLEAMYNAYGRLISEENQMIGIVSKTEKYQGQISEELRKQLQLTSANAAEELKRTNASQQSLEAEQRRGQQMVDAMDNAANKAEFWNKMINGAMGAFGVITSAIPVIQALGDETKSAAEKFDTLGTALLSLAPTLLLIGGPVGLIAGGIAAVAGLALKFMDLRSEMDKVKETNEETAKSFGELKNRASELTGTLQDSSIKEYTESITMSQEDLNKKLEESGESYEDYSKRMRSANEAAQARIAEIAPHLVKYYDEEGKAVVDVASAYVELTKEYESNRKAQNELMEGNLSNFIKEYHNTVSQGKKTISESQAELDKYTKKLNDAYGDNNQRKIKKFSKEVADAKEAIANANKEISETKGAINQNIVQPAIESSETLRKLPIAFKDLAAEMINVEKVSQIMSTSLNPEEEILGLKNNLNEITTAFNNYRITALSSGEEMAAGWKAIENASSEAIMYMSQGLATLDPQLKNTTSILNSFAESIVQVTDKSGKIYGSFMKDKIEIPMEINQEEIQAKMSEMKKNLEADIESFKGDELGARLEEGLLEADTALGATTSMVNELRDAMEAGDLNYYYDMGDMTEEQKVANGLLQEYFSMKKQIVTEDEAAESLLRNRVQQQRELNQLHFEQLRAAAQIPEVFNAMVDEANETYKIITAIGEEGFDEMGEAVSKIKEDFAEAFDGFQDEGGSSIEDVSEQLGDLGDEMKDIMKSGGDALREAMGIDEDLWDKAFADPAGDAMKQVTDSFGDFYQEYSNMILAMNADNAEFFAQMKQDASNIDYFGEIGTELGVFASQYATYGEFIDEVNRRNKEMALIYSDEQATGVYNNLMDEAQNAILTADQKQQAMNGTLDVSKLTSDQQSQLAQAAIYATEAANAQAQANILQAQLVSIGAIDKSGQAIENNHDVVRAFAKDVGVTVTAAEEYINKLMLEVADAKQRVEAAQSLLKGMGSGEPISIGGGGKSSISSLPSVPNLKPPGKKPTGGGGGNKNQKPGGGDSGKGGGGKGGKGDKGKEDVADLELDLDPYKYFKEVLEDIETALGRVQKAQKDAFGDEKRKLMEEEMKLLQQQLATQEELFKTQKGDLATRAKRMESYGFELDAMGNISNYNERIIQLTNQANSKTGEAKEIAQEQLKFIQEQAKEFESLREEAQKMGEEMKEIRKELEQTYLDFITSFKDEADEASDTLNSIWDLVDDMNEGFDGVAIRFENSMKRVQDSMDNVKNSLALIKQVSESTELSDETKQAKMKELLEDILGEIGDLNKAWKELQKLQVEALKDGVDLFEEQIDKIKELNDNMDDFAGVLSDIYGDEAYDQVLELNKLQLQGIEDQMAGYDQMIAQATDYLGTLEEGSDAWKETQKVIDDLNQDKLELSIEKIEKIKDIADQMFEKAKKDLEEALFGPGGLDAFEDRFDKVEKDQEKYVSNLEKARLISDLTARIQKEIEATNDPKKKAQLNKFLEDEIKMLTQKDKLTHTEVERAELLYQLELQRLAMNERQQALMTAQLTRDESGGFSYQYVKEPSKKKDEEDKTGSILDDLIALDQEALRQNQQEIKDVYTQLMDDISKLNPMSETYEADIEKLRVAAIEQMKILQQEQEELIKKAQQSGMMGILEGFGKTEGLEIFGGQVDETIKSLTDALANGSITFNQIMDGDFAALAEKTGISADLIEETYNAMIGATTADWEQGNLDMDLSTEALMEAVQDYIDKMTNNTDGYGYYKDAITAAIKAHQDSLGDLDIAMDTNQANLDETIGKIKDTTTQMGALNTSIGGPTGLKAQLDAVNTIIGSPSNKDSFLGKLEQVAADAKKEDNGLIQTGKNADLAKQAMNNAKTSADSLKGGLKSMSDDAKVAINAMWDSSKNSLNSIIGKIGEVGSAGTSAAGKISSAAKGISSDINSMLDDIKTINAAKINPPQIPEIVRNKVVSSAYNASTGQTLVVSSSGKSQWFPGDQRLTYMRNPYISWEKGGYTGEGGRSGGSDGIGGMPAILHPREFVMNREITDKMLTGVDMIQNYAKMLKMSGMQSTPSALGPITQSTPVAQDIHITAEFPNATNRSEIEDTFRNLSNLSLQWAHSTKSS